MDWDILSNLTAQDTDKRTTERVPDGYTTKATLQVEANPSRLLYVEGIATGPEGSSSVESEESACESKEER